MRRALALALALALPCYAQDAGVPPAVVVSAGELVPHHGLLLSDTAAIDAAKRLAGAEAKAVALEEAVKASPSWWVPVLVGVVALGAGVGLGYGISRVAGTPPP